MNSRIRVMMLAGFACAAAVFAHHSFSADFDANKPVTLKGVVTKVEWTNPHIWVYMDVTDERGEMSKWAVEGDPPNILFRSGWRKDSVKPGDTIIIDGHKARDGSNTAHLRTATLPDGQKVLAVQRPGN